MNSKDEVLELVTDLIQDMLSMDRAQQIISTYGIEQTAKLFNDELTRIIGD